MSVVILNGARTPQGKLLGQLSSLDAVALGAHAIAAAVQRSGVAVDEVDAVVMGQVLQAGCGQNPARQASVAAGLPLSVPAATVNMVCLSGLLSIVDSARRIAAGEASVVVAGGMESMSNAPRVIKGTRAGVPYGDLTLIDAVAHDGLTDAASGESMGLLTDAGNAALGITRQAQDEFAARSHVRAAAAQAAGVFDTEIAPVTIPQRKGDPIVLGADEGVRPSTTPETLARLRPAFTPDGTITAGNASPISDGAAAVVLADRDWATDRGLTWLCEVGAAGEVAGPDTSLHAQPAHAITAALARQGWAASDLDIVEINEAFASVGLRSTELLGLDPDMVNIYGGAIAIGHPIGASGARITLLAANELARRDGGKAAVALCGGGGQGEALLLAR